MGSGRRLAAGPSGCPFCLLVESERQTAVVFEDEVSAVILDDRPLFPGHCLVIPREHVETLADLPAARLGPLFATVQLVARAVETGLDAQGSFVAVNNRVSQSVAHLHVHVVPRRKGDGLRGFFWPRGRYRDAAEMAGVRDRIRSALAALLGRQPDSPLV
ncbi:MAG TPA: HIT family protein [Methylomirabilota bacterium]|nr:HIT family protein [Methylomirabilota bacterium]